MANPEDVQLAMSKVAKVLCPEYPTSKRAIQREVEGADGRDCEVCDGTGTVRHALVVLLEGAISGDCLCRAVGEACVPCQKVDLGDCFMGESLDTLRRLGHSPDCTPCQGTDRILRAPDPRPGADPGVLYHIALYWKPLIDFEAGVRFRLCNKLLRALEAGDTPTAYDDCIEALQSLPQRKEE